MPISNLNNSHLSTAEQTVVTTAIKQLETALASLNVALTPEERSKYGSINEQNKLLVNKCFDYHNDRPELADSSVDWDEFHKDYQSRDFEEKAINRINACLQKLFNSKVLHDHDNWQAALQDYAHTSYQAKRGNPDYEDKHDEMKQFFNRTNTKNSKP